MPMSSQPIALFTQNLEVGGAERVMLNLATALADLGHRVDLVLSSATGEFMNSVPANVRVVDLGVTSPIRAGKALRAYYRRENPRITISALNQPNVVTILAQKSSKVKAIVTIHSSLSQEAKNATSFRMRVMPLIVKSLYAKAEAIVAVSEGVAQDASQFLGIDRSKIRLIFNPIVSPESLKRATEPATHPWLVNKSCPVVVAAGRLMPPKDFPLLLNAFAKLPRSLGAKLIIFGEGDLRRELTQQISALGLNDSVSLPGFSKNVLAEIAKADLFVLSSKWEGLPSVLIEALGCGVPVVSTDCISGPREILQGGKYGPLVPVGDAEQLAKAIEKQLGPNPICAPSDAWQPFSFAAAAQQYLDLVEECLARS